MRPDRRGQGIARALLDAAVGWARTKGFHTVRLGVTGTNAPAYGLYRKAGFIPTGDATPLRPGSPLSVADMERRLEREGPPDELGARRQSEPVRRGEEEP